MGSFAALPVGRPLDDKKSGNFLTVKARCNRFSSALTGRKFPQLQSGLPRHELEALARCLLPDILAFFESDEGRREFEEWKKRQENNEEKI